MFIEIVANCQQVLKSIKQTPWNDRNERCKMIFTFLWQAFQCFWTVYGSNYQRTMFFDVLECMVLLWASVLRWSGVFAPSRENEKKTIHRFTRYPRVCGVLCKRTMYELCRSNCIGEPHPCKEYKGLLGANYANRARLVSVGKLSRKTKSRAELSAKSKHNIKVLVNQGATVPLRLRALTNKATK